MVTVLIILIIILHPVPYNMLVPLNLPRLDDYFQSGQIVSSKMKDVMQTIIKQVGDKVYSELTLPSGSVGVSQSIVDYLANQLHKLLK